MSVVFATLNRHDLPEQLRLGGRIFGALVVGAYLTGWLLLGLWG